MGYKGIDNKDINVTVKNKQANEQILKAYLPEDQQKLVWAEFSKFEKKLAQEKKEIIKDTKDELKQLKNKVHNENIINASVDYGNLISGKITLKMMYDRMNKEITDMKGGKEKTALNMFDAAVIMPVQIALNRAGYPLSVDGVTLKGGETEKQLKAFQLANKIPTTGMLDQPTMEALATYVSPSWEGEQVTKKQMIEEEAAMLDMSSEKLQKAGDDIFDQGQYLLAARYYKNAAKQYVKENKNATDNPVETYAVNKYFNAGKALLDETKRYPNSQNFYKIDQMKKAHDMMSAGLDINPELMNKVILDARSEEDQGARTFEGEKANLARAQRELARVTANSTDTKKADKKAVWDKQVTFWTSEVTKAQTVVDSFKKVVIDQTLKGDQLITAYINAYMWPLPVELPNPVRPEKNNVVIIEKKKGDKQYIVKEKEKKQEEIKEEEDLSEKIITMNGNEELPADLAARSNRALKFINEHFTNGQKIQNMCLSLNLPANDKLIYVVKDGDNLNSIWAYALSNGLKIDGLKAKDKIAVGQKINMVSMNLENASNAYGRIAVVKIAEPFLKLYDANPKDLQEKCKALAARMKISLPNGDITPDYKG